VSSFAWVGPAALGVRLTTSGVCTPSEWVKTVILEMFYPESYFLKYEILNQVQDDRSRKWGQSTAVQTKCWTTSRRLADADEKPRTEIREIEKAKELLRS
ncbi:hypothetical protein, partial [Kosmotoga sp. DU53]|uniref:hypothetical protein n=1 Tax=Kosmotoga sp. DU53 TaxID=1310160 RepID=UPI001F223192